MDFNWRSPIFTRLAILAASVFVLGYSLGDKFNFALSLIFILAVAFQLFQLVNLFENKLPDRTDQPKPKPMTEAPAKPDDIALFFRNIVQHIGIGILTFNKEGKIQTVNAAAKRMLRIEKIDMLEELRAVDNLLVDSILRLKTGGRELVRLKLGAETLDLSLYAIELTLRGEPMKLISMSNIQSELEEKEMEAWRNLVRVLTHEIMNSVTPISSLAGVVEDELQSKITNQEFSLKDEELHDMHLSVQTIGKRSQGLIRFVKEFRNLTHVPQPKLAEVNVKDLLEEIVMLHKKELINQNIETKINVKPDDLCVQADKTLIEQVLINLMKNAIQAFDLQAAKTISLSAYTNEGHAIISVKDNGSGIDADALERIFVPFFTTKKTGSGIGLSLSRQIMRQHGGQITVNSLLGEGTEFLLRF
ncbi:MAG: GHKL domain-containing protein [Bacteroidetes bacterium]|nr:GHKL domain-containing protein [Bacteroidota bacterium]MBS1541185.1 GHKL domain-containing protein [Bacteroidota bacterium]